MILNDVCEFIVDCPHTTAPDTGGGYPLIRTPNIGPGRFLLEGVHRVSEKTYKERTKRAVPQDNDLIFAREAPAGNVAIIKNGEKYCLGQRTVLIRPDSKLVNPDYLTYYLLAPEQQYGLLGTANGATVPHVNLPTIRNLKISLPSFDTQRRIADILSSYDDLIENKQGQIKLLEEAAVRIYKEWFVYLRFPGHENTSIINGAPEGWTKSNFESLCTLIKDSIAPKDIPKGIPYIGLEHIPRKSFCLNNWSDSQGIDSNKFRYLKNDVIFGKIRPYFHKVGFSINDGVCSTDAMVFRANEDMFGLLLMISFSEAFVQHSYQTCKEGAKMPRADWNEMRQYSILLPTKDILKEFNNRIESITELVCKLTNQILLLKEARDKLLPKLMSGKIEV